MSFDDIAFECADDLLIDALGVCMRPHRIDHGKIMYDSLSLSSTVTSRSSLQWVPVSLTKYLTSAQQSTTNQKGPRLNLHTAAGSSDASHSRCPSARTRVCSRRRRKCRRSRANLFLQFEVFKVHNLAHLRLMWRLTRLARGCVTDV